MIQIALVVTILAALMVSTNGSYYQPIILQPVKPGGEPVALIIIPGALCKAKQYKALAEEIQRQSSFKVWVSIPSFTLNMATPLEILYRISQSRRGLKNKGFPQGGKIFISGHSLGGVMIQNYGQKLRTDIIGQILLGSQLTRSNFKLTEQGLFTLEYPLPTLTIGGEKDGLTRPIKMAQAHYRQSVENADKDPKSQFNEEFPVVLLEGVNHMNFADGGNSFFTKQRDFASEVTLQEAHQLIASTVVDFMNAIYQRTVGVTQTFVYQRIPALIENSLQFFNPNIMAMQLEGSYFLKPACFTKPNVNPPNTQCTHGSPWVQVAQTYMSGLEQVSSTVSVQVDDNSHRVWSVTPVHLPHIWNTCADSKGQKCVLNLTTVSQTIYKLRGKEDPGSVGGSALEIRAKLTSRQNAYEKAGIPNPQFNQTDTGTLCGEINQEAINWALSVAPQKTLDRYQKQGMKMVIGNNLGPYNQGNQWIKHKILYEKVTNTNGERVLRVSAPYMATPTKFIVKNVAGFHYCKLLSPLKVMQWIFSGSLQESEHQ